jgi:hypothetical protein
MEYLTPTKIRKEKKFQNNSVDRYIPSLKNININNTKIYQKLEKNEKNILYNKELEKRLFSETIDDISFLNFNKNENVKNVENIDFRNLYSISKNENTYKKKTSERIIKSTPDRILGLFYYIYFRCTWLSR